MRVELDVFSGRENPQWEIDDADARALRELVRGLALATSAPPEPPGLGYRGIVFDDEGGRSRAFRGCVIRPGAVLADPSSTVERFLLDRVPQELAALRERILREQAG